MKLFSNHQFSIFSNKAETPNVQFFTTLNQTINNNAIVNDVNSALVENNFSRQLNPNSIIHLNPLHHNDVIGVKYSSVFNEKIQLNAQHFSKISSIDILSIPTHDRLMIENLKNIAEKSKQDLQAPVLDNPVNEIDPILQELSKLDIKPNTNINLRCLFGRYLDTNFDSKIITKVIYATQNMVIQFSMLALFGIFLYSIMSNV